MIPAGVKVTDLGRPDSTIVGRFYEYTGAKRAAILAITGSNGGIDERMSPLLASNGYWEGANARARFGGDPHFDAPGRSSWSRNGKPLPFVHKYVSPQRLANRPAAFLDEYEPPLDHPVDPETSSPSNGSAPGADAWTHLILFLNKNLGNKPAAH